LVSEGLRIELLEDSAGTFFENGSAVPRTAGVDLLTLLGVELGGEVNNLIVEGHTDARPFSGGTSAGYSNWELSVDRANAARRILLTGGVQATQIQEVRGHADRELRYPEAPLTPGNRRVSILVVLDSTGAKPLLASPDPWVERGNR
jgi:chemotaxis protein MotB